MFYLWAKGARHKPSTSVPWLHQSGAKDKTRRGTETERRSGQEKPGVTQSERSSSPWCKGRVSLRKAEGRTLIVQKQQAAAGTCRAAHRAEATHCLSIGGLSRTHWVEVGDEKDPPYPLCRSAALMRHRWPLNPLVQKQPVDWGQHVCSPRLEMS